MTTTGWDPDQYERFAAQRRQPFTDLVALLQPVAPGRSVVDLGCGTGELTRRLHLQLEAGQTLGVDNSAEMLARARPLEGDGLRFVEGGIASFDDGVWDIVFSNAALQWVPDHPTVLARWAGLLRPGGQLAVQVPANRDHPSHLCSVEVAREEPFVTALGGAPPADPVDSVLAPEEYATLLHRLGLTRQHVRLQVYGHVLASVDEVVEWTKGTSLVRFRRTLPDDLYEPFVVRYRQRLIEVLCDPRPYFYAFKRILFAATRPT